MCQCFGLYCVCFLCATFWLLIFCLSEMKKASLNSNHTIPFQPMSNSALSFLVYALVCLEGRVRSAKDLQENRFEEQGYLNHWSSKVSVFLAKTPTSFRRPYVWSARIVLQQRLRRVIIFAKLKPLVSYMIMLKLMLLQCQIEPCLFMEKCRKYLCVNIYIQYAHTHTKVWVWVRLLEQLSKSSHFPLQSFRPLVVGIFGD